MEHFDTAGGGEEDRPRDMPRQEEVVPELHIVPDISPEKGPEGGVAGQIGDVGTFIEGNEEQDRTRDRGDSSEDRPHWKTPDGRTLH